VNAGTTAASSLRVVEVFADIYCPYTHVGLRRLVGIRADLERSDVVLRVRAWPLELVNGAALTAHHAAEEIKALREVVAPDLFVGFDVTRFPKTTLPALALVAAGYRAGNAAGEAVSLALRTALFEEGRDVSDSGELALVARSCGIDLPGPDDREAVLTDWREGQSRSVTGSPHFFVGDRGFFCPTLDIERRSGHLHVAYDEQAFAEFAAAIFGPQR
jgi:predicted DsbA family dithiol-disulfide isomerase